MRNEYILFKRKGQAVWYFYYYQGNKRVNKSTGKTTKAEATKYAKDFTADRRAKTQQTFGEFTKDFFIWGSCRWIKNQLAFKRRISERWAGIKRKYLENHILPVFGDRILGEITKADIRDFIVDLPGSGQHKNHVLYTLKQILQEAEDREIIEVSKATSMKGFTIDTLVQEKARGVFTDDESSLLFPADKKQMLEIWNDEKHAALFLILESTGIRLGEARALFWEDFDGESLYIHRAVKDEHGTVGTTKTGVERYVFPSPLALEYMTSTTFIADNGLMFPGEDGTKPYTQRGLFHSFLQALKRTEIIKGNRSIHSFRHGYNTRLINAGIDPDSIRLLMGHKTARMTANYDKPSQQELKTRMKKALKILGKDS
ncbi:MAG: hypothetical protein EHM28_00730 [Spirochaetaceae bacterium]|nr:MAG: hypothetical protein EHM28_00730 [Spirochaetaceae bacterium]